MRVYILLLFAVGCRAIESNELSNFNETFKEYSKIATNTISSIENVLNASRTDLELFLDDAYSNNPILNRLTKMKYSDNKCFAKFIDRDNFKLSLQIQNYQLQIPLHTNIMNIKEKVNYINSSLGIYQRLAENKLLSCKSQNKTCWDETAEWLESALQSLNCTIYPDCTNHSVSKRSTCLPGQFKCKNGQCITGSFFCDYVCQCSDCSDQPPGCVKSCAGFRCRETFHCILPSQKCNGADDCGDGSDEEDCPSLTTTYSHSNCSRDTGDFLCKNKKCIGLEQVCDGYDDCGDWSDEDYCETVNCSPECGKKGGVCYRDPNGAECLYECPPGTYETSLGCKRNPEAPLPTLLQVLEETPRLTTRYAARLRYLKTKTLLALSKSLRELVKCKKEVFTSLSKIIDFSTIIDKGETGHLPESGLLTSTTAPQTTSTTAPQTTSTAEQSDVESTSDDWDTY